MPKGKGKNFQNNEADRELELKEHLEEYAKVSSLKGDRKVDLFLPDSSMVMGCIRGNMRKRRKSSVKVDDVVLVSVREFQKDKVDIIHVYNEKEVRKLIQYGEIPDKFGRSFTTFNEETNVDIGIDFEEEEEIDFEDI